MKMRLDKGLPTALAALAFLLPVPGHAQSVSYTYTYNGLPLPIFRDNANIISLAYVFVPKAIRITKVTANVEIDYPHPGDLNLFMYSPILTRTKLLERNCGSQGSVANVTFDDDAPTRYSDVCPSNPGSYRGNEPLSNFNGQIALGTWTMAIENNGSDDLIGFLRGVTLVITGTVVSTKPITGPDAVYNVAGFQSAVVAPGEMINIEGINLGPSPAMLAPAGDLPSSLGGVQVTFDGTPAAVSFVSPSVLTVEVPFSLTPGKQSAMQVTFQANTSDPVMLDVLAVVPGVYTQNGNGRGPATVINQDGSTNSLLHPAGRGQYVTLYAAGLGTVTPALATGQVPPASPTSHTTTPISALIDGFTANVAFAGAAPGYPGLYQVNVQVPPNAGSGARSLLLFGGGGSPSQAGVAIYVQ